jgi:hypothetical protein
LIAPVASWIVSARLDTSVGVSGPHDFAVRDRVTRPRIACALTPPRPSHPASRFVTIAHTPLQAEAGCAHDASDLGSASSSFPKNRTGPLRQNGTTGNFAHGMHAGFARHAIAGKLRLVRGSAPDAWTDATQSPQGHAEGIRLAPPMLRARRPIRQRRCRNSCIAIAIRSSWLPGPRISRALPLEPIANFDDRRASCDNPQGSISSPETIITCCAVGPSS